MAESDLQYAELSTISNFSFLTGASHPEELVVVAKRFGYSALGVADINTVAGVVRAHMAAKEAELDFHPGCRLRFSDGTPDIIVYPKTRRGWGRLCRLLTTANMRGEKGASDVREGDVFDWLEECALIVMPRWCDLFRPTDFEEIYDRLFDLISRLIKSFKQDVRLGVTIRHDGFDDRAISALNRISTQTGIKLIACGDVRYHTMERRPLGDVIECVRDGVTLKQAGKRLQANGERFMKPLNEISRLYSSIEDAFRETVQLTKSLSFSLHELRYNYPDETVGNGETPQQTLKRLAWEGARERYPDGITDRVRDQIRYELELIEKLEYAPYFLTVQDIVRFARSENILCQGRGSAANSTVCYCIGITEVDPMLTDLLFERFISPERREPPDIDVDFEHARREEVIQYIYQKYGHDHAGLAATVITYRTRSAAREVAKVFGLSQDVTSAISSNIWGWHNADLGEREAKAAGLDLTDRNTRNVFEFAQQIMGFPRHLSQHVGGFVITQDRLDEVVPITKSGMESRTMVEWDKDDLDSLGILKIDILALGMLTCIGKALDLLALHYDEKLTLATMPKEDERVYHMICRADTLGVFQIESRAQMTMLPRLRPRAFYDLVIEVAIVRPGPIQGDMVHPYLRRRQGKEAVSYPSKELEGVLGRTLGVPLFQEQAMKIAIVAADFSPGEADKLRRAMATFRRVGTIHTFQQKMVQGMVAKGYEADFAERCFKQIEGFGEYGFPESHAASFALLVYASCWLKAFYPDVFCAAILNSQPMGFYAPSQLVRDAREHGVEVRAVDINASEWDCTLEVTPDDDGDFIQRLHPRHREMSDVILTRKAVRLGFRMVKGLSEETMNRVANLRGSGYDSVRDLWLRTGLSRADIERLADADAFRSLGLDRRAALWAVRALDDVKSADFLPLFDTEHNSNGDETMVGVEVVGEPRVDLPAMAPGEHVVHDYRALGLSLKAHPVSFLRNSLKKLNVVSHQSLDTMRSGRRVTIAGLVLVRQRPGSAKGVIFATLEDETGVANVIIWPKIFEKFRSTVLSARLIKVTGRLQSEDGVTHVVADRVEDLTAMFALIEEALPGADHLANEGLDNADEVRSPVNDLRQRIKPRSRLARLLKDEPTLAVEYQKIQQAKASAKVMPKGRNFH